MTLPDRISRAASVVALGLVLATSPARAGTPETPAATAEQLAEKAYQEHASGKDAEAIATYLRAYELSQASAILYNVAMIYDRKLREHALAEDYYRRYLLAPDAEPDLVRKATERLTALKKQDEDEAAAKRAAIAVTPVPSAPAPQTSPPPPPEPPAPSAASAPSSPASPVATSNGRAARTAGIAVGAVGVVGLGASAVLAVLAKGKNDDANAVCNGAACASQSGVSLASQAGSLATASTVAFVAGLALVGGGVTIFFLAPKDAGASPASRIAVSPQAGPSSLGLSVGGTF